MFIANQKKKIRHKIFYGPSVEFLYYYKLSRDLNQGSVSKTVFSGNTGAPSIGWSSSATGLEKNGFSRVA